MEMLSLIYALDIYAAIIQGRTGKEIFGRYFLGHAARDTRAKIR